MTKRSVVFSGMAFFSILVCGGLISAGQAKADESTQAAQDSTVGYAGVLLGPSFMNENLGTAFMIGGHVGAKILDNFGLGLYVTYQPLSSVPSTTGGSINISEVVVAAEPNYYLLGDDSLYVGAKVGLGITSGSINTINGITTMIASGTSTGFAGGPAFGYNFKFTPNWSAGAEVNAVFVTTSGSTLDLVNILFGASYWF